jgi:hypothetical protein
MPDAEAKQDIDRLVREALDHIGGPDRPRVSSRLLAWLTSRAWTCEVTEPGPNVMTVVATDGRERKVLRVYSGGDHWGIIQLRTEGVTYE